MYHIIQNNKIISSSSAPIRAEGCETIERDFPQEDQEKIRLGYEYDGEKFTPTTESSMQELLEAYTQKVAILREKQQKKTNLDLMGEARLSQSVTKEMQGIGSELASMKKQARDLGLTDEQIDSIIMA